AAILLQCRLVLQLERLRPHDFAVHLEHHIAPAGDEVRDLTVGEPADETDCDDPEHRLGDFAHRAHHSGPDSGAERVRRGISLKTTTRKLKRTAAFPIDSPPEQTLSSFNSPNHLAVAYTSEIEKLEKRWLENPKGRNFAPLADAYRKAGELDRALDLCKAGLELHPDYVSAHIVFGRCLMDQKNDPGASEVFRKVLALDPENVLALKILAEIADRGHRYDEAVDWLTRLLSADPMNGDAAEALTRARGRAAHAAARPSSPPAAAPVLAGGPEPVVRLVPDPEPAHSSTAKPVPHPPPPLPPPPPPAPAPPRRDFVVEHESETRVADAVPRKSAPPPGEIETYDGTLDFNSVAHDAAKADGLEVAEEVELKPQDLVGEGLAHTQYESVPFEQPPAVSE